MAEGGLLERHFLTRLRAPSAKEALISSFLDGCPCFVSSWNALAERMEIQGAFHEFSQAITLRKMTAITSKMILGLGQERRQMRKKQNMHEENLIGI